MRKNPYFYACLSILCWSTVATAFKLALNRIDFQQLLFYSALFSLLSLVLVAIIQGKKTLVLSSFRGHGLKSAFLGLFSPFGYYLVLFKAYSVLPAQQAQPLNYTWPLVLVILSALFLKEKVNFKLFLGIIISFCGVVIIATRGNLTSLEIIEPFGVVLAVGSSFLWATYWLFNVRDELDVTVRMLYNFFFGFIYCALFMLLSRHSLMIDLTSIGLCFYIGMFEMGVTFVFWSKALQLSQGTTVSHLVYLSPFISLVFIRLVLEEELMLSSVAGLVLIIAGILYGKTGQAGKQSETHSGTVHHQHDGKLVP